MTVRKSPHKNGVKMSSKYNFKFEYVQIGEMEKQLFKKGRKLFGSVVIAILAGIYSFWVIIGSGKETVFYGTLLLLSSAPVYVWMKWHGYVKGIISITEQPSPLP